MYDIPEMIIRTSATIGRFGNVYYIENQTSTVYCGRPVRHTYILSLHLFLKIQLSRSSVSDYSSNSRLATHVITRILGRKRDEKSELR